MVKQALLLTDTDFQDIINSTCVSPRVDRSVIIQLLTSCQLTVAASSSSPRLIGERQPV